jgi:methionyl-tRNA formyltransferase
MENPPPHLSETAQRPWRILFMGTPALAAHVLERLIAEGGNDFVVAAVVTRPDQPRKRGLKLEPSEVGAVAARHNIPTLKPTKIRTPEFLAELRAFNPTLIVVVAYGRILPNSILELAPPVNVHASLLPRHRGAAPIEGAILAGDRESGITIMRITEKMDAGPILFQRAITLAGDETQGSLKAKPAALGASALIEAVRGMERNALVETPQDEQLATYTELVKKEDSTIDWSRDAATIERMVRAFDPWPIARTTIEREALLIWRTAVAERPSVENVPPGTLVELTPIPIVQCGVGSLKLLEVQAPGRRRIAGADFLRGRRVVAGFRFK